MDWLPQNIDKHVFERRLTAVRFELGQAATAILLDPSIESGHSRLELQPSGKYFHVTIGDPYGDGLRLRVTTATDSPTSSATLRVGLVETSRHAHAGIQNLDIVSQTGPVTITGESPDRLLRTDVVTVKALRPGGNITIGNVALGTIGGSNIIFPAGGRTVEVHNRIYDMWHDRDNLDAIELQPADLAQEPDN